MKNNKKMGWRLALMLIVMLGATFQVAAQSYGDILPLEIGDFGGKWETWESGETVFAFPDGHVAKSTWIQDGNTLYYVDASGCLMKENYSHDGYYVGKNGTLDKSVKRLEKNVQPHDGKTYISDETDKTFVFQLSTNKAHFTYYILKADYSVISLGRGVYILHNIKDEYDSYHVVVLDGGKTLRVSSAGETEVFNVK